METNARQKKKKKQKIKSADSDDELDAMLAELQMANAERASVTKDLNSEACEMDDQSNISAKTAAQKKKEKKERQKQKNSNKEQNPMLFEEIAVSNEKSEGEEIGETKKGKKKKKKGGEKDEESKKKAKGLGKGALAMLQEAQRIQKADQERIEKEELEKARIAEESENDRLEKIRIETEKKEAKKLKEKEKREQLRKEGKLLTNKQKQEKARAESMLAAMREKGLEVPVVGEKKGPRPGTRIRTKKNLQQNRTISTLTSEPIKDTKVEEVPILESKKPDEKSVSVKESWDASSDDGSDEDASSEIHDSKLSKEEDSEVSYSNDESSESSEGSEEDNEKESRKERALARIENRRLENEKKRNVDNLRAPVVCVLGHVDTGKTKILDKLRRTHVQDGEAGGITQQIGATNVPIEVIKEQCKMVKNFASNLQLPGLLIIDTPGHESFSNLRDRGSSLCDIAILVVDIMHNLEPQTIESLNLLRKKKTPFVIALNKIDRLYEWKPNRHRDVKEVIDSQTQTTKLEFEKRAQEVVTAIAEQGLNAALYYNNPDPKTYISMVPTSAHSGDGMGNLMAVLVQLSQKMLAQRLAFSEELQATVLEVKAIAGLGHTIDIVLVNGTLREGQTMILAGTDGPIVTQIKALLTPAKMQDLRVKSSYIEHKVLTGAQGVKIAAKELDKAIAGLNLLIANQPDEIEICKDEMEKTLQHALNAIKLKERGVFVQASTLGSLEALLEFLKASKIPYAGVKIGPVVRKDVMKASVMLEHEEKYTIILAFDVKVEKDAQEMADSMGVKIFQADIIYHLFDRFTEYQEELKKRKRDEFKHLAIFPCKIRMLPNFVFNSRDPIVAGVIVEAGVVRQGTPICVPSKEFLDLGIVTSIECNHKEVETARKGEEICIKIEPIPGESPKMFGRHFDENDILTSKISRASIDTCKQYFREDLQKSDWALMVELKKIFEIM